MTAIEPVHVTEGGEVEIFDPADEHGFVARRFLPDGTMLGIAPQIYTSRLVICPEGRGASGYSDCWCYENALLAVAAMALWDGTGEPTGWHRHPPSGRRRPDGDPEREYVSP